MVARRQPARRPRSDKDSRRSLGIADATADRASGWSSRACLGPAAPGRGRRWVRSLVPRWTIAARPPMSRSCRAPRETVWSVDVSTGEQTADPDAGRSHLAATGTVAVES